MYLETLKNQSENIKQDNKNECICVLDMYILGFIQIVEITPITKEKAKRK